MSDFDEQMKQAIDDCQVSSMLTWWPLVKDFDIPMPKTIIMQIGKDQVFDLFHLLDGNSVTKGLAAEILGNCYKIGYPLFLRTDQTSGKHEWKNSCFVANRDNIWKNLGGLIEYSECASGPGLPIWALVFREYIDMDSKFTAFEGLPISPERRYFILDGEVVCHHQYWPEKAIEFYEGNKDPEANWRQLLEEMNKETDEEIELLTGYATQLGQVLKGYWSVDFCKSLAGKWYFIDAAVGRASWHPEECEENRCKVSEKDGE